MRPLRGFNLPPNASHITSIESDLGGMANQEGYRKGLETSFCAVSQSIAQVSHTTRKPHQGYISTPPEPAIACHLS